MGLSALRRRFAWRTAGRVGLLTLTVGLCAAISPLLAAVDGPFPEHRAATRAQATGLLLHGASSATPCLTPRIQELRTTAGSSPLARRTLALLQRRIAFARETVLDGPGGIPLRYASQPHAFDAVAPGDHDGDGIPDVVQAVLTGLQQARELLVDGLDLPAPQLSEILLVELGQGLDGYYVASSGGATRATLVIDSTPEGGPDAARRAAAHQFAHAVAASAGQALSSGWAEALATWTPLALDGAPDQSTLQAFGRRLAGLQFGLLSDDPTLASGNGLWLAFLHQAYGISAVRMTLEELAHGGSELAALDRAVRRASSGDLASAFREFHLWTLLTGERNDGHHFSFGGELPSPEFASTPDGLPALSVQADPALAPLGAAQVLLTPHRRDGGLRIHFEGEFAGRWEADLLIVGADGTLHRLALSLEGDERGEKTIPLDGLSEAILLIRNVGGEADGARRYTFSAHRDDSFPFEMEILEATDQGPEGVLVSWETSSEQQLIGFNLLRYRDGRGRPVIVTPVWVPALGDPATATAYHFLDRGAEPGASYVYRVQGITSDGLTSLSGRVSHTRPPLSR